ncbi:hypothetical protein ig2599ANME_0211 [groundwater metagenome]
MGTITVNIKDDVEKEFRNLVRSVHGTKKGDLGRALTEAMRKWVYEKKQEKIAREALKLLEQKFTGFLMAFLRQLPHNRLYFSNSRIRLERNPCKMSA